MKQQPIHLNICVRFLRFQLPISTTYNQLFSAEMPSTVYCFLLPVILACSSAAFAAAAASQQASDAPRTWALLVAGSDTYSNYR
jgi:hypothetical protein